MHLNLFFENVAAGVSVHYSHNIYEYMYFKSIFFHLFQCQKQKKNEQSLKQKIKKLSDLKKKKELSESSLLKCVWEKDGADVGPSVAAAASTSTYRKRYGQSSNSVIIAEDEEVI
jgi:hypothetical protein